MARKKSCEVFTAVKINGSPYSTARGAAVAWAEFIYSKMDTRKTKQLGYAAYHLESWDQRGEYFRETLFRRSLPIFERIFNKV